EEKGTLLTVDAPQRVTIKADPGLVAQAIGNLVDNAIKYSGPDGRVTLRLAREDEGNVSVVVRDDGPGISEQDRKLVTRPFYRGSHASTAGTGLGLSLAEAVARLHGGSLELADGEPGLVAALILPVAPKKPVMIARDEAARPTTIASSRR